MTFTFTAVVKATAAKFNFAACSRHAKCSFRVRLHTKNFLGPEGAIGGNPSTIKNMLVKMTVLRFYLNP
jgi:hypothetical protein